MTESLAREHQPCDQAAASSCIAEPKRSCSARMQPYLLRIVG